jgi:ribosomal protein L20A (L18A)
MSTDNNAQATFARPIEFTYDKNQIEAFENEVNYKDKNKIIEKVYADFVNEYFKDEPINIENLVFLQHFVEYIKKKY